MFSKAPVLWWLVEGSSPTEIRQLLPVGTLAPVHVSVAITKPPGCEPRRETPETIRAAVPEFVTTTSFGGATSNGPCKIQKSRLLSGLIEIDVVPPPLPSPSQMVTLPIKATTTAKSPPMIATPAGDLQKLFSSASPKALPRVKGSLLRSYPHCNSRVPLSAKGVR
jgi:hypothetical protein